MRTRTAITTSLVAMLSVAGTAQLLHSTEESIDIPVGSIFEMQAVTDVPAQFSWTLNQGEQFMEASRNHVFQTRFTQAGDYTLLGQVGDESGAMIASRVFQIHVRSRKPEDSTLIPETNVGDLIIFQPKLQNGELRLNATRQVLEVRHARGDIAVMAIDLDTERDANDDGNAANDDDTRDTLFRGNPNPLHIWFTSQRGRPMKAGALLQDSTTKLQDFAVRFDGEASAVQQPQNEPADEEASGEGQIVVLKSDNGTLQFAVRIDAADTAPKLYQWKFGDGGQSLLDKPVHIYAEGGTYDVSVTVRDLKTGAVVSTFNDSVIVNRLREGTDTEAPPEDNDVPVSDPKPQRSPSTGLLGMIVKVLLGLILSIAVGIGIMFAIVKLKKKRFSLEKTVEKAEQSLTGKATQITPLAMEMPLDDDPLPPREETAPVIGPAVIDAEPMPEEDQSEPASPANERVPNTEPKPRHTALEPSAEQLITDAENAPSWLKVGMQTAEAVGQTPVAPPPPALNDATIAPETPLVPTVPATEEHEALSERQPEPSVLTTPPVPIPYPQTVASPAAPVPAPAAPSPLALVSPGPIPAATPAPAPIVSSPQMPTPPIAVTTADDPVATPAAAPLPPAIAPSLNDEEREAREREKKRLKRQRYRENRKKRDAEKSAALENPDASANAALHDDETIAIIRAEDLGGTPPPSAGEPKKA